MRYRRSFRSYGSRRRFRGRRVVGRRRRGRRLMTIGYRM